jgi:hypothetical protein
MVSVAPEHSRSRTALAFPAAGRGNLTACLARSQPPNGWPAAAEDAGRLGSTQVNCSREAVPFCLSFPASSFLDQPQIMLSRAQDQKSLINSSND